MSDRAKKYSGIRYTTAVASFVYLLSLLILFQICGLGVWLRVWIIQFFPNQALLIFFYSLILFLLYFIFNFPLEFYRSYLVEQRFGLSNEKFSHWLVDQIKGFLVGFFISIILIEGFFYFLRHNPGSWWWICSLFWMFFSLILTRLFPVLIIPIFFKYKKVDNDDLRQRILNLAGRMGVKILDVYQIDFSKKTTKANAALTGLGKSRRVILTDTLQHRYNLEEIEAILAHEFSHLRLRHIMKTFLLNAGIILFVFYILFRFSAAVFIRFNLTLTDVAGLGIWIFCFTLLQVCFVPLLNWISRNMERNADRLAIESGGKRCAFISMMQKLSEQNLVEPKPSRWVKILFFDHPPAAERIAFVEALNRPLRAKP